MILKRNAKQRKNKIELMQARQQKDDYDKHIKYLLDTETMLSNKKIKIEDAVTAFNENESMVKYLKENGIMDEAGHIKAGIAN